MAIPTAFGRDPVVRSDESAAVRSVVLLVSVVVGGLITLFESIEAVPIFLAIATLALALALAARLDDAQPWAASVLWAILLLGAEGLGIVPPLMMIVLCLALAVGPDRLLGWVLEDWGGRRPSEPSGGWIEEG